MTHAIRPARPGDAAASSRIAEAAYTPFIPLIGRRPMPMEADFAAQIGEGKVWVSGEAEVTGYVVAYPKGTAWMLENVAVDPACHGQSLGRALITHVEALACAAGAEAVELYTNAKMEANLRLYPALGYAEVSRGRDQGFDRVFFRKPL